MFEISFKGVKALGVTVFIDEQFGSSAAQPDGKRRGPARPASGTFMSERVEARYRERRERFKAELFVLSGTSLDTPPAAVPIRLFLWGGTPPRTASLAMPTSSDI